MSYLIDTNVISELRKKHRCDPAVRTWWSGVRENDLYLSPLVLGEIRKGVELARNRDPEKAVALEAWLARVSEAFADRMLPIDAAVADEWGRINAIRPLPVIDALLAATAKVNGLTLVTRKGDDVAGLGASILNPFSEP
ncbi:MAG TPA: type II toxin-antitoxin system VapC family toxin [Methylomirabilota bacterium]|nr:type II toxin-antitoxin system VapC family toxin [Methylomirabilota bacterium]